MSELDVIQGFFAKEQKEKIDTTLKRLNYKIERYEIAVETGKLTWD